MDLGEEYFQTKGAASAEGEVRECVSSVYKKQQEVTELGYECGTDLGGVP